MSQEIETAKAEVAVRNIGGIDECRVTFDEGVTILVGRNATNRTSLLTALAGVLGGSPPNLKTDCEEGEVTLTLGDETYTRRYEKRDRRVSVSGDPYCEDSDLVDMFVAQLEDNPVRRAVERGDDLRDIVMEPVDTEEIESRLRELKRERKRNEERIEEIDRELDRLPTLESRHRELEAELEEVEKSIEELQETVAEYDADSERIAEARETIEELEELRGELSSKQQEIETQRASIDALREEYENVEEELERLEAPEVNPAELEDERSSLKTRERNLAETIDTLSAIVEFNENLLEGEGSAALDRNVEDDVTAELDPMSKTVECWTCGSEVERSDIAGKLDALRDVLEEKREKRNEVRDRLDELQERTREIRSTTDEIDRLKERKATIREEINDREATITDLQEEADDIRERIAAVKDRIEETKDLRENNVVEKYQRLTKYEYKRGQLEQELCELSNELEDLEKQKEELERLEAQQSEIEDEIASLRSRVDDLETEIVEAFNEHMMEVLSLLSYENVERVWIERTIAGDDVTPSMDRKSEFDLHVVREAEDGSVYEDRVDTLSESEREVIGLVVSLTGYLVHRVHESVPMMLLDSLEAIDSRRIADLIDYFAEHVSYLVVALLPEDERAVDDRHDRIRAQTLRNTSRE